jgi:UDP-N-acetylmuramoyl-L-alanyl-D-glutamate--2,6-diaminopimelate ligase
MQLSEMVGALNGELYNMKQTDISTIECHSDKVNPGALFVAIRGKNYDGHDFIEAAERRGAAAVMTERKIRTSLPQVVVNDTRKAMGTVARMFYGSNDMVKVGITGTNGKTTTAFLIHSILNEAGMQPALIGTIYYRGKTTKKAVMTTPESLDLFKMIAEFRKEGSRAAVMEVSSHALSLHRVDELRFNSAIFTNLSQDHLDFHKTWDGYRAAKLKIFSLLEDDGWAVYNCDDPVSVDIDRLCLPHRITYGMKHHAMVRATLLQERSDGIDVEVFFKGEKRTVHSSLIGRFNVYNICAGYAAGIALKIDHATIVAGIEKLQRVEGRMQQINDGIFVDYAHTPSALKNALEALRTHAHGKLVLVFGCGGDRDKGKRPLMAQVASALADFTVITTDNPRSEPPQDIIRDIEKGMTTEYYTVIEDRRKAIHYACSHKERGDILLVAGKGHETYQIIGDTVLHFDDAEVIRECITKS